MGAFTAGDGFVISLPYGTQADWLKNVLSSGSAIIVDEGSAYPVDQPELLPTAMVAADLPPKEQRNLRVFRVDQCLRVRRVVLEEASLQGVDPA